MDTSPSYYEKVVSTRTYQDRLETLYKLQKSSIKICCGGIIGMGESVDDRVKLIQVLSNFNKHPHVVPINYYVRILRTPYVQNDLTLLGNLGIKPIKKGVLDAFPEPKV